MSASRVLASSFRAVARPSAAQSVAHTALRSGYSSIGKYASSRSRYNHELAGDVPWFIGSVGFTVAGLTWLLSRPGEVGGGDAHGGAPVPDEEKAPAVESTPSTPSPSSDEDSETPPTNPDAAHGSPETDGQAPPPSADSSDEATDHEDKKEAHEGYEMVPREDTGVATSSSDVPSTQTAPEHPHENPQKGEGGAMEKGEPNS
ncbi:hypothetical protein F4818DRAFT_128087 [Hypoxylon cercidicola]|nr:hypothetical protein F4818DRAFT_128087 [Hypoxylon cercidicola]